MAMQEISFDMEILSDYLSRGHVVYYYTRRDGEAVKRDLHKLGADPEVVERGLILERSSVLRREGNAVCSVSNGRKVYKMACSVKEMLEAQNRPDKSPQDF
jgi:hypothetical protein